MKYLLKAPGIFMKSAMKYPEANNEISIMQFHWTSKHYTCLVFIIKVVTTHPTFYTQIVCYTLYVDIQGSRDHQIFVSLCSWILRSYYVYIFRFLDPGISTSSDPGISFLTCINIHGSTDPQIFISWHHESSDLSISTSSDPQILGSSYLYIHASSYLHFHGSMDISTSTDHQNPVYLHHQILGAWYLYIFGSSDPGISTSLDPGISTSLEPGISRSSDC